MLTSKLYVPQSGARGGAEILLDLPRQGSGLCQFSIQRGGQSNHILAPSGWQSSDFWFESECQTVQGNAACVYLPPELVRLLSFSNYKILGKWRGQNETAQTILRGGDVVTHPLQGAVASTISGSAVPDDQVSRLMQAPQVSSPLVTEAPALVAPIELPSLPETRAEVPTPASASQHLLVPAPAVNSSERPSWVLPLLGLLVLAALAGGWMMMQKSLGAGADITTVPASVENPEPVSATGGSSGQNDSSAKPGLKPDAPAVPQGANKEAGAPNAVTEKNAGKTTQASLPGNKPAMSAPASSSQGNASGSDNSAPADKASPDLNRLVIDAIKK